MPASGRTDDDPHVISPREELTGDGSAHPDHDRPPVLMVASVAVIISCLTTPTSSSRRMMRPASPLACCHLPWMASSGMVALDASRRNHPVPRLAQWSLSAGIVAAIGANLPRGLGHGPVCALVSAWPALALVGSFEFSPGVPSLLRDVALECLRTALATHLMMCGACCPRCSEAWPRADLQQMQHPARRWREVDQGSTSANRDDALIAKVTTPRE
jgi:hypothetical protein